MARALRRGPRARHDAAHRRCARWMRTRGRRPARAITTSQSGRELRSRVAADVRPLRQSDALRVGTTPGARSARRAIVDRLGVRARPLVSPPNPLTPFCDEPYSVAVGVGNSPTMPSRLACFASIDGPQCSAEASAATGAPCTCRGRRCRAVPGPCSEFSGLPFAGPAEWDDARGDCVVRFDRPLLRRSAPTDADGAHGGRRQVSPSGLEPWFFDPSRRHRGSHRSG